MFLASANLISAFSRRHSGNMSLVYGDTADSLKNRKTFLSGLGIDYRELVCAKQVHAANTAYIRLIDKGRGALLYETSLDNTDAFITDKKNVPLAIFTADCLSVFLYDPKNNAIGLVHAGWRSSREEITFKAVQLMKEKFNTLPEDLRAGLGPCIRKCCYEVGEEFKKFFPGALIKKGERYFLDLIEINRKQLLISGAKDANIFDSRICTSCQNKNFFSYRKEAKACGRIMSVVMLK